MLVNIFVEGVENINIQCGDNMKEHEVFNHDLAKTAEAVMNIRILLRHPDPQQQEKAHAYLESNGFFKEGMLFIPNELWVLINADISPHGIMSILT